MLALTLTAERNETLNGNLRRKVPLNSARPSFPPHNLNLWKNFSAASERLNRSRLCRMHFKQMR